MKKSAVKFDRDEVISACAAFKIKRHRATQIAALMNAVGRVTIATDTQIIKKSGLSEAAFRRCLTLGRKHGLLDSYRTYKKDTNGQDLVEYVAKPIVRNGAPKSGQQPKRETGSPPAAAPEPRSAGSGSSPQSAGASAAVTLWSGYHAPQDWARVFACNWITVLRRIRGGSLRAEKLNSKSWRFDVSQLPADWQKSLQK